MVKTFFQGPKDKAELHRLLSSRCALHGEPGVYDAWVKGYPMASLYAYRGPLRQMLLDFKVKGSWQSGMALVDVFCADPSVLSWVAKADYLMPVPSSFWGRWHGKHDLGFALADGLSQATGIPLVKAPWSKYFRFKKQSFLSRSERLTDRAFAGDELSLGDLLKVSGRQKNDTNLHGEELPEMVLIDDIVTSANTLTALAGAFRNIRFRFLTLASAYHYVGGTIRSSEEVI
ncbi:MAG: hypothetical protein H7318_16165 [Oligoflexus sp.]|nr:hypothetical protein [Oligoflexus sp.]